MCGIVAEHGGSDPEALERMLERLAHRGPDDRGTVQVNGSWLGHRRLSIVDVGGGQQPLSTRDESAFLVGNGEVYNHEEVRAGLVDRELLTTSDNEVALHLIDERGVEGPRRAQRHVRVRDGRAATGASSPRATRVGIKPLYWAQRDGAVRFASEMHAFDPEWQSSVRPFPPGCAWTPEGGMVRFASAVPAASELAPVTDHEALLTGTRDVLVQAVEQQMMGDVNVGVFLSGGLDSSLVAAIAARIAGERGRRLQTFAVGTEGSPDLVAARQVAEHLDCEHTEVTYTAAEALESLPNVVRAIESFDPGLVRSAVPNYMLARTTRQHVKVVLTGEGADELFAGYDYMREFADPDALHTELERTGELAPQPQPPALRPRDDGPLRRGARPLPRPPRDRLGAADPARERSRACRRRSCCARRSPGWLPDEFLYGARRPSSATARAPATCSPGGRGDGSPTKSSRPSAARSSRRCARRRGRLLPRLARAPPGDQPRADAVAVRAWPRGSARTQTAAG
jgi:asparagine synthase (glutamine-hydrolysing)